MSIEIKKFTREEHAQHCMQLVRLLRRLKPREYRFDGGVELATFEEQSYTAAGAFGWAAVCGIGGLVVHKGKDPVHPDILHLAELSGVLTLFDVRRISADHVFGEGAWEEVFGADSSYQKKRAGFSAKGKELHDLHVQYTDLHLDTKRLIDYAAKYLRHKISSVENRKPAVVITMGGGVIQGIAFSEDMDVLVVDYDVNTLPEDEMCQVSQGGFAPEDACVFERGATSESIDPQIVYERLDTFRYTDGKEA